MGPLDEETSPSTEELRMLGEHFCSAEVRPQIGHGLCTFLLRDRSANLVDHSWSYLPLLKFRRKRRSPEIVPSASRAIRTRLSVSSTQRTGRSKTRYPSRSAMISSSVSISQPWPSTSGSRSLAAFFVIALKPHCTSGASRKRWCSSNRVGGQTRPRIIRCDQMRGEVGSAGQRRQCVRLLDVQNDGMSSLPPCLPRPPGAQQGVAKSPLTRSRPSAHEFVWHYRRYGWLASSFVSDERIKDIHAIGKPLETIPWPGVGGRNEIRAANQQAGR